MISHKQTRILNLHIERMVVVANIGYCRGVFNHRLDSNCRKRSNVAHIIKDLKVPPPLAPSVNKCMRGLSVGGI